MNDLTQAGLRIRFRSCVLWTLAICCLSISTASAQTFTGEHYELVLKPDFESRMLHGKARIRLRNSGGSKAKGVDLLSPSLQIRRASLGGKTLIPERTARGWHIPLTPEQAQSSTPWLEVDYQAPASAGLVFGEGYVYTAFHTCKWMPCAGPDLGRASIASSLDLPAGYRSVASGQPVAESSPGIHRWLQSEPYPLYTLGFSAGPFIEILEPESNPRLRYLAIEGGEAALRHKFKESLQVLAFFEDKAGLPLPQPMYTQVLLPGGVAQEASSFSLIGHRMLDPIVENPQEDWVIAHEMAHQWWGNLITCATWDEFWLNEGMTVFMTAAWKQHRWGEAAYQREMKLAEQSWQRARNAGFDRPLSWAGKYPSLRIKRAIHYSKGTLFLNALRGELGEEKFWDGLRHYTRENAGRSVRASDLQKAMEQSAGRSLQALFDAWVY